MCLCVYVFMCLQTFSLGYPGVSEAHSFAETCDWRTQGSGIGAATINEGKRARNIKVRSEVKKNPEGAHL